LQDVELAAQALALIAGRPDRSTLDQIAAGQAAGLIEPQEAECLRAAARLFWTLQCTGKLLTGELIDPDRLGEGGRRLILREAGADSVEALARHLADVAQAADAVITAIMEKGAT